MKVALIGPTGQVGSHILKEALDRGHVVTGILRHPEKLPKHERLAGASCEVRDTDALARAIAGHDAAISAFNPALEGGIDGARSIVAAVKRAGVPRLLVVGGAGSMDGKPGVQLVDLPGLPEKWRQHALATREFLNLLREEPDLAWTFLAPAMFMEPGKRTGRFRTRVDMRVETEDGGPSRISLQDYAVAMIDELERALHTRQRFTIGY